MTGTAMTSTGDGPDHTALRVALWRARHLEVDAAPPVLDDSPGLLLADPDPAWRDRPDMDPDATRGARAGHGRPGPRRRRPRRRGPRPPA